jgi:hypothetical protein
MSYPKRKRKSKEIKKEIYIFCEGTETEKHYFNALKQIIKYPTLKVKVKGTGESNKKLLDYAVNYTSKLKDVDGVWIVYDKDDLKILDIKQNFELANKKGVKVAFSNISFEIWLLLHYEKLQYPSSLDKKTVYKKLEKHLGLKDSYENHKNDVVMLSRIAEKYKTALSNNKSLLKDGSQFDKSPYSDVCYLIEYLCS